MLAIVLPLVKDGEYFVVYCLAISVQWRIYFWYCLAISESWGIFFWLLTCH